MENQEENKNNSSLKNNFYCEFSKTRKIWILIISISILLISIITPLCVLSFKTLTPLEVLYYK